MLRFLQGLTVAETAEVMGRSDGAVKQLQLRAVRALAKLLPEQASMTARRRAVTAALAGRCQVGRINGVDRYGRAEGGRQMTMIMSARRREAEDLQRLLDGGRASSPGRPRTWPRCSALARGLVAGPGHAVRRLPRRAARAAGHRGGRPGAGARRTRPSGHRAQRPAPGSSRPSRPSPWPRSSPASVPRWRAPGRCPATRSTASSGRSRTSSSTWPAATSATAASCCEQADARLSEAERPRRRRARLPTPQSVARVAQALTDMDAAVTAGRRRPAPGLPRDRRRGAAAAARPVRRPSSASGSTT